MPVEKILVLKTKIQMFHIFQNNVVFFFFSYTSKVQQIQGPEAAANLLLLSNPTSTEFAYKNFQKKKTEVKSTLNSGLLAKYGGAEHLKSNNDNDGAKVGAASEIYVEYLPDGRKKEQPKEIPKSKYLLFPVFFLFFGV